MSGLGQTLGRWNAHTYQNAAAVLSAGLNDGALWIINEGGKPTQAGIWPYEPGPQVHAFATYRDLYAGKGALAAGDYWRIESAGYPAGVRVGQIDPNGMDGLCPHPFECGLYPLNSNTMQFGVMADGDIEQLVAPAATLTPTALHAAVVDGEIGRVRLPLTVGRPAYLALHAQLTQTGGNTNQQFYNVLFQSSLGLSPEDSHGSLFYNLAPGNVFQNRPFIVTNGAPAAMVASPVFNLDAINELWNFSGAPGTNYYNFETNYRLAGSNNAGAGGPAVANNGMDLSNPLQYFFIDLKYGVLLGGDDCTVDFYGIEVATQELTV